MSRHSQHVNDRQFFSYKERADAGFSQSKKQILGGDCFLPFGMCALSLQVPRDPVATPQGWIYEREYILEYLLQQKKELLLQRAQYDDQERRKEQKQRKEEREAELRELEDFTKLEQSIVADDSRHKRKSDDSAEAESTKRLRKGELRTIDKADMRAKSFWVKENTSTATAADVSKADLVPKCPMSRKKLRVKDLIPVKFEVADQKLFDAGGGQGVFCCAVTKKPISHQQSYLIKPTGQVVLESVLKDCVYPTMTCPITSKKIQKEDLLKLQQAGTGFSAHNEIEAKVFADIRSRLGDDCLRQGHLGSKGTSFRG